MSSTGVQNPQNGLRPSGSKSTRGSAGPNGAWVMFGWAWIEPHNQLVGFDLGVVRLGVGWDFG